VTNKQIDPATVAIPKGLRMNAEVRRQIAEHMAEVISEQKATPIEDVLKAQKDLTDRLLRWMWSHPDTGEDMREGMKNIPDAYLPRSNRCDVFIPKQITNPDNAAYDTADRLWTDHYRLTFVDFEGEGDLIPTQMIVPGFLDNYYNGQRHHLVLVQGTKMRNKAKKLGCDFLPPDDLAKDIIDFLLEDELLHKKRMQLIETLRSGLNSVHSVSKLREKWPEAFAAYVELFGSTLTNTALVKSDPIKTAQKVIDAFPDEVIAA